MLILLIAVFVLPLVLGVCALVAMAYDAPDGYEDAEGWHRGRKQ